MFATGDKKGHAKEYLTSILKVMQWRNNFFIITIGFLDPENIPMKKYFQENLDGKAKIQGICTPPLWAFSVGEKPWVSEG